VVLGNVLSTINGVFSAQNPICETCKTEGCSVTYMYVCMYVCIYVCMYVCIYMCVCVCVCVCVCALS